MKLRLLFALAYCLTLASLTVGDFCPGTFYYKRVGELGVWALPISKPGHIYAHSDASPLTPLASCDSGVHAQGSIVCCLIAGPPSVLRCLNTTMPSDPNIRDYDLSSTSSIDISSQLKFNLEASTLCIYGINTLFCNAWSGGSLVSNTSIFTSTWTTYVTRTGTRFPWSMWPIGDLSDPQILLDIADRDQGKLQRFCLMRDGSPGASYELNYAGNLASYVEMLTPFGPSILLYNTTTRMASLWPWRCGAFSGTSSMSGFDANLAFMEPTQATCTLGYTIVATKDNTSRLGFITMDQPSFYTPGGPGAFFYDASTTMDSFSYATDGVVAVQVPSTPTSSTQPPQAPSLACPEPKPKPSQFFECDISSGVWVSPSNLTTGSVEVGSPVVIEGDFSVSGTLTLTGTTSFLDVRGCVTIGGDVVLELTEEELKELTKSGNSGKKAILRESQCSSPASLSSVAISIKSNAPKCQSIKARAEAEQGVDGDTQQQQQQLLVIFSIDKAKCRRWWIILVSVLSAVLVISLAIALFFTFNTKARSCIRPFSKRNAAPPSS